jgi:hypothetical protein
MKEKNIEPMERIFGTQPETNILQIKHDLRYELYGRRRRAQCKKVKAGRGLQSQRNRNLCRPVEILVRSG